MVPEVTTASTYVPAAGKSKSAESAIALGAPAPGAVTVALPSEAPSVAIVGFAPDAPPVVATGYRWNAKLIAGATAFVMHCPWTFSFDVGKSAGLSRSANAPLLAAATAIVLVYAKTRVVAATPPAIADPIRQSVTARHPDVEFSTSVIVFAVILAAIRSPTTTGRADDDSCARVIVSVSVDRAVTLIISAFDGSGLELAGHTVALNGTAGNRAPSAAATTSDVPELAGLGAVATELIARFACASTRYCEVNVRLPEGITNVSPIATVFDAVNAPEPRQFPAVDASHIDTCVSDSAVLTEVHVRSASEVAVPPDDAPNEAAFRVVSPAAFAVPFSPGSPVCNFTYGCATCNAVLLHTASLIAFSR